MKYLLALLLIVSLPASAGPFTDAMSRCLVKETTAEDKSLFMKWMFAAMSFHPEVESLAAVTPEEADALNQKTADLMVELLAERCQAETQEAMEYEGESAIKASFEVFGQVAMMGLLSNEKVAGYLAGLETKLDLERLEKAFSKAEN